MDRLGHKPTTEPNSLEQYLIGHHKIESALCKEEIDWDEYQKRDQQLLERFNGRVSKKDIILFDDLSSYVHFLYETGFDRRDIQEIVAHEKKHFEEAQRLGYSPKYGVWCCTEDNYKFMVYLKEAIDADARRAIALKPDDPSSLDKMCD